ncbi:MAG TPA: DUF4019 domain-containing protein [Gammaproteobacteria bacterium]|nr:DUF4019 domain-containing protein [Gammaproteobacteria bacterium]
MRILWGSVAIAAALLLAGCGPRPAEQHEARVAEERARQWIALIDSGDYGGGWEAATSLFQLNIAKDEWQARARRTKLGLGDASGRTLVAARYTASYPMTPVPGEYVIVQYRTRFGGRAGIETVYMRRADGLWKTDGYLVRWEAPDGPRPSGPPPVPTGVVVDSGIFYSPIVADLDAAVAFYRDGLGFDMPGEPANDASPQQRAMLGLPDARIRRQVGRAPPIPGGVEIVEIAGGRPVERSMDEPGTVMLLVIVADLEATLARLKQLGAPVVTTGGAPVSIGQLRVVVVKDPAGHFVQLTQTARTSPPPAGANPNVVGVRVRHTVRDLERSIALYRNALGLQGAGVVPGWESYDAVLDSLGLATTRQYRFVTL